jgi:hypothetical protein
LRGGDQVRDSALRRHLGEGHMMQRQAGKQEQPSTPAGTSGGVTAAWDAHHAQPSQLLLCSSIA